MKHSGLGHPRLGFGLTLQLISLVTLVALGVGGGMGLALTQSSRNTLRAGTFANSLAHADLAAEYASEYLNVLQAQVRLLATRPELVHAVLIDAPEQVQAELAQFLILQPAFDGITLFDAQGIARVSGVANPLNLGQSSADRDWFQQTMVTGKPYQGIPVISRATGHPNVPYGVPIFDAQRRVSGVLVAGISTTALADAITQASALPETRASLIDFRNGGIVVVHRDPQRLLTPISGKNQAVQRLMNHERGVMETLSSTGELDLIAYAPVPDLPWGVLVITPAQIAFAPIDQLTHQASVLTLTAIAVAACLGGLWMLRITRPMIRLRDAARRLATGALTGQLQFTQIDEIGEVGRAFDQMAQALSEKETQLRRYADELEQQVVERTAALRDSEQRYRLISENSDDVIWLLDLRLQRFTYISPSVYKLRGFTPDEVLSAPLTAALTAKSQPEVALWLRTEMQMIREGQGDAKPKLYQVEQPRKDGSTVWTEVATNYICDEHGEPTQVIGVSRDITARRQSEAELRKLSRSVEQSPASVVITNPAGTIEYVNPKFTQLTGYTAAEAIGQNPRLLKSGETMPAEYTRLWNTITTGGEWHGEFHNRKKNGELYWESAVISAILDADGQIAHFVAVKEDITGRKQAEQSLRESEERYRCLYHDAQQRIAELQTIHKVSTALRSAQTLDEMLPIFLDETLAILDATDGSILLDGTVAELHTTVTRGWLSAYPAVMSKTLGIAGQTYTTGQPYIAREFVSELRTLQSADEHIPAGWGGACIPIRAVERVVGVMFVAVHLPRELTLTEVQLLTTLSEIVGNAIQRTQLHAETMQNLQRLKALQTIDHAISENLGLHSTLDILLSQVIAQLGVDAASVLLLDPSAQVLRYADGQGFRTADIEKTLLRLGQGYAGQAAQTRRIQAVPDLRQNAGGDTQSVLLAHEPFGAYYGVPLVAKGQVKGVLEIFHREPLNPNAEWLAYLEALAGQAGIAIDNAQLFDGIQASNLELALAYETTLEGWSRALDLRDQETEGHTERVTAMTLRLAQTMGIGEADLTLLRRGALLHDIGKMGIPDSILLKPGKLTDTEWAVMRKHPVYAQQLIAPITYLRDALDIPYCHHEKWDGTGYPRGLVGEQIPLAARLFAIVDVWDALTSDRPYRKAWSHTETLAYIQAQAGRYFDPVIVQAFMNLVTAGTRPPIQATFRPRVLIVDDEREITRSLARSLRQDFEVLTANSGEHALELIAQNEIPVLLTDQRMPGLTGLELLKQTHRVSPRTLGVLISGYSDPSALNATLQLDNVRGFVPKPWDSDDLQRQLHKVAHEYYTLR